MHQNPHLGHKELDTTWYFWHNCFKQQKDLILNQNNNIFTVMDKIQKYGNIFIAQTLKNIICDLKYHSYLPWPTTILPAKVIYYKLHIILSVYMSTKENLYIYFEG